MFKEAEKGDKEVYMERTEEALCTGADVIATACPFCMTMLTDGLKYKNKSDTVKNLEALHADIVVLRHPYSGAPHLLSRRTEACVINAGDGWQAQVATDGSWACKIGALPISFTVPLILPAASTCRSSMIAWPPPPRPPRAPPSAGAGAASFCAAAFFAASSAAGTLSVCHLPASLDCP